MSPRPVVAALGVALAGCVTVPPASFIHAVPLTTVSDTKETGIDLAMSSMLGGSLSHTLPAGEYVVVDLRGQGNVGSLGLTPGVWVRGKTDDLGFGARVGANVGTGDAFGAIPLVGAQYAGPTLHLQFAGLADKTRVGVTLGAEYTLPLGAQVNQQAPTTTTATTNTTTGPTTTVTSATTPTGTTSPPTGTPGTTGTDAEPTPTTSYAVFPGFWFDLNVRAEFPTGEGGPLFAIGGGIHSAWGILYIPQFTLGLRFH